MNRNTFIKSFAMATAATPFISLKDISNIFVQKGPKMPTLFIGHGSPMNVLAHNEFTKHLNNIGTSIETPKAILVISAHWLTRGSYVSVVENPETIYDFGGFPKEMYEVKYPAPGSPEFAKMVIETVKSVTIQSDHQMGLDHGAWTVLKHIYPKADIPVFQLSMDATQGPQYHYNLGKELQELRSKGVLILASGNIVHNLRMINFQDTDPKPYDWALEFDTMAKDFILKREHKSLISYPALGKAALTTIPTNDHYLPMLYTLALQEKTEEVTFLHEGFEMGSISNRCFMVSAK